jgi:apolipoprotein D and lipocalin family protein
MLSNILACQLRQRNVCRRSGHLLRWFRWLTLIPVVFFQFSWHALAVDQCLPTVPCVDLYRYSGTWYEIARLPNIFQRNCRCSTAQYVPDPDGSVTVINSCTTPRGRQRQVVGRATTVPGSGNARLRVGFGRLSTIFAQRSAGNYWIIDIAPDYSWAMVGTPDRKFFWILSRTPQLPSDIVSQLTRQASDLGFDTSRLIFN